MVTYAQNRDFIDEEQATSLHGRIKKKKILALGVTLKNISISGLKTDGIGQE